MDILNWEMFAANDTDTMKNQHTLAGHFGKADLKSGRDVTPGHVSSFGVPNILHDKNVSLIGFILVHYK